MLPKAMYKHHWRLSASLDGIRFALGGGHKGRCFGLALYRIEYLMILHKSVLEDTGNAEMLYRLKRYIGSQNMLNVSS